MEPIVTIAAVVVGGAITGGVTWILARIDTRRRHRLDYLIGTYHALHDAAQRKLDRERADALEHALDRVFLYGNAEQLRLAAEFRDDFAANGGAPLDPLLLSLRRSVRRELGLRTDGALGVPVLRVDTDKSSRPRTTRSK